jgi:hypothetical protein
MNTEKITILALFISTLITIIGWIYTASVQKHILKETRKSQSIDREITIFRERLATVRDTTSVLLDMSMSYQELVALIGSGQFTFESGSTILSDLIYKEKMFYKILVDPAFRTMQSLLPQESALKLHSLTTKANEMMVNLHASAIGLSPLTPDLNIKLKMLSDDALQLSIILINTADTLANDFAILDKSLAHGQELRPSAFKRAIQRLRSSRKTAT